MTDVLVELWRQTLGPKGHDTRRHILHASVGLRRILRLQQAIEARLGVTIPPTALMRLGTIEALANAIDSRSWPAPSPLVLLRDGQPDRAVYLIAAGSGVVLELCDLALLIDFPGQIWGLQLPGLDGETAPLTRIEDIARHYVDNLRAQRPTGPYHLIGYSFSGLIVLEMARILRASGDRLGLVGLLDSTCYEKYWPRSEWVRFAVKRTRRRLAEVRNMPPSLAVSHLRKSVGNLRRLLWRRRAGATATAESTGKSIYYIGGLEPDFQRVRDASIVAFEAHQPSPIDGRIVLFKSLLGDQHACNPVGIWKRLISDLEIVVVPGSHVTMVRKPLVETLAREISNRLG